MSSYRLPENTEGSIIGCILLCPDTKPAVSKLIDEQDFASPAFGAMFSAAMELDEPDSVKFKELVKQRGYELPDGFFAGLTDIAINRANVELYAELLRADSIKRKLLELSDDIKQAASDHENPIEILSNTMSRVKDIERGTITGDIASPEEADKALWEHRKRVESGDGYISTGFSPLDAILGGGMMRTGLYILAARPGMGKTTVAIQFADHIAQSAGPVLFVSLEMSVEQIQGKRIARIGNLSSNEVLLGNGKKLDYRAFKEASLYARKIPLYISKRPGATVSQIRQMAKQVVDLKCIVVDYLGKITPHNTKATKYEATSRISNDLKRLAMELHVPVLSLAQLNRENTNRANKRPQLSDLRDSGEIEQDADGVIMLHREDYYEVTDKPLTIEDSVELEMLVEKDRYGNLGLCTAAFFPACGRIVQTS